MMINATFFVQMLHFAIAYFVIDRILLRHVVRILRSQQREEHYRAQQIERDQHQLEELRKKIAVHWENWQRIFFANMPSFAPKKSIALEETVLIPEQPEKKKVDAMRNALAMAIVNRLGMVHDNG
jgi:hypothetical protein